MNIPDISNATYMLALPSTTALIGLIAALIKRHLKTGYWFFITLIGQAAALQLIEAGPNLRYQHYLSPEQLWEPPHRVYTAILVLQIVSVAVVLLRRWKPFISWLRRTFKTWQILAIGLVFVFSSAALSTSVARYLSELLLSSAIQAVNLACIAILIWSIPHGWTSRFTHWLACRSTAQPQHPNRAAVGIDRFVLVAALWVVAIAAMLNVVAYERIPHVPDEAAYLIHARYLAEGIFTTAAPPVPELFDVYLMQFQGGRWFPVTLPGWPAMLAVGVKMGVPWFVNPLLAGLNLVLAYLVLGNLYPRHTVRTAILLLSFSPWYIFLAMSLMTHMFTLTCTLAATLGVIYARDTARAPWALFAGTMVGLMSLVRPLEALIIGALLGLWALGVGGRRLKFTSLVGFGIGTVLLGGLILPYNHALTGRATAYPINVYTDQRFGHNANAYGFGPDRGMGWPLDPNPGHSPLDGAINAALNTFMINVDLFGWSTGSLLLVALLIFAGNFRRADTLMFGVIAGVFIAFFFYYFSGGPDFGARYWFLMIVPLCALSARGLQVLQSKLPPQAGARVLLGVMLLTGFALVTYIPWRAIDKYHHYRGMRPDIGLLMKQFPFEDSLILIRGNLPSDYASAAIYNPLDMYSREPIFAWDRDPDLLPQLIEAYPQRSLWVLEAPSISHGGYQVVAGPLNPEDLLATRAADE